MQKLWLTGMKSFDQFISLHVPVSGTSKLAQYFLFTPTDSITLIRFASSSLTVEKLVKDQAYVRTDLELAAGAVYWDFFNV
ncbi:hypothetical protein Nepgr_001982 [Nepenthes gracilis]|uniref:Uncharacterized protein n=1 Tax=Nepenthes gracilis TaxID=150966 RepID=A0AAD3P861_NEPGR|nr:hypothetical protein Nepgr_001982 [Nepenthes gracilis]